MAAPTTYLTLIKRIPYRGNTNEEWSNSYALTGATPTDSTAWRALFDALVTQERQLYASALSVVGGYGYNKIPATGDHAIWSVDLTVSPNTPQAGQLSVTSSRMAGDQASWIRWGLDRFNTNGKRVYLRKYFHGGDILSSNSDQLGANSVTALTAFAAKMWDGSFTGGRKICDKFGEVPIGAAVSPYVTTRTLKRRGKRPGT